MDEAAIPEVDDTEQLARPQHNIAAGKQRRQIKPLVRYDYTDIAYVLTVGYEVETNESRLTLRRQLILNRHSD